jgi:hypothetical protein
MGRGKGQAAQTVKATIAVVALVAHFLASRMMCEDCAHTSSRLSFFDPGRKVLHACRVLSASWIRLRARLSSTAFPLSPPGPLHTCIEGKVHSLSGSLGCTF